MPKRSSASIATHLSEAQQNAIGFFVLVAVAGLFAIAYRWGVSQQSREGTQQSLDLKRRGDFVRDQLRKCQNKTQYSKAQTDALKGESADIWQHNKRLEEENNRLVKLNEDLEKRNIECVENSELTKQQWAEEDAKNAEKLNTLDRRNRVLRRSSKRLSGTQGMRTILLLASIKKLAQEMLVLRAGLRMPSVTVDTDFIDELVDKWQGIDAKVSASGGTGPMSRRAGEVLPPNRSEMWSGFRRPRILEHFDPDRHNRRIFFPKRDEAGEWQLPCWNARCGSQDLRHGTYLDSRIAPVTDINRQMRVLYEYALCAVGNNITKFMYPTSFKRCTDCPTEYIHHYIETPLVLFCDDCRPQHTTNEFRLLCQGHTSDDVYGSAMFWRTRSRLRFKGRFVTQAQAWLGSNAFLNAASNGELDRAKSQPGALGVRLRRRDFSTLCAGQIRKANRPTLAFSRILHSRVAELGGTFDEQCFPAWAHVYKQINIQVQELRKLFTGDPKVYVSTDATEEEWTALQAAISVPVYRRLSTGKATEDDITDTYITAHCDRVIVNRYDIKSTHVAEVHMLLHKLDVGGIRVW